MTRKGVRGHGGQLVFLLMAFGSGGCGSGGETRDQAGAGGAGGAVQPGSGGVTVDGGPLDGDAPDVAPGSGGQPSVPADGASGGSAGIGGVASGGRASGTGGVAPVGGGPAPGSGGSGGGGGRIEAGGGAAVATGGAGGRGPGNRAVDLLFMIDDSASMAVMQQKLAQKLPDFMTVLKDIPGGLPSLHVAVISSSLGAGRFSDVPGCLPTSAGNQDGAFQHDVRCAALHQGETFISSVNGTNNFDGDIADVFACIAMLGDHGCGFEHQFESTRIALQRAMDPADRDNAGFLRSDAVLAVVMLTNEDDCSASADSDLFDPRQMTLADPYGGLSSYRCNEFGHLCNGVSPPHEPGNVVLAGCTSAEERGKLLTVKGFVDFLKNLKAQDSTKLLVAALAGPAEPYVIEQRNSQLPNGAVEVQPSVVHSCTQSPSEYADPAVRIKNWSDAFGANGIFENICAADFGPALKRIADGISRLVGG